MYQALCKCPLTRYWTRFTGKENRESESVHDQPMAVQLVSGGSWAGAHTLLFNHNPTVPSVPPEDRVPGGVTKAPKTSGPGGRGSGRGVWQGCLAGPEPRGQTSISEAQAAAGRWGEASSGVQGLTQHPKLQLPGVHPSPAGGLTAVRASIGGSDGCKVDGALGPLAPQGHPVLGPGQPGLRGALGHTVQVQSFARQGLQDPRAWLHLWGY